MLIDELRKDFVRHGSQLTNPAFVALAVFRFGTWANRLTNPVLRKAAQMAYTGIRLPVANVTKVWLEPGTRIDEGLHIIHAEGSLSIHPDAVIGKRLGVMHNVTIGGNMVDGVPVIGDDVFIGVNSTVLGPIKIGDRVRIGANTCVTTDVPSDSVAVGSPAKIYPRLAPAVVVGEPKPSRRGNKRKKAESAAAG
jgi:serine O-acetyltransferase